MPQLLTHVPLLIAKPLKAPKKATKDLYVNCHHDALGSHADFVPRT